MHGRIHQACTVPARLNALHFTNAPWYLDGDRNFAFWARHKMKKADVEFARKLFPDSFSGLKWKDTMYFMTLHNTGKAKELLWSMGVHSTLGVHFHPERSVFERTITRKNDYYSTSFCWAFWCVENTNKCHGPVMENERRSTINTVVTPKHEWSLKLQRFERLQRIGTKGAGLVEVLLPASILLKNESKANNGVHKERCSISIYKMYF